MNCIFLEDITNEDCQHFVVGNDGTSTNKGNSNLFNISYEYFSKMQLFNAAAKTAQEAYQDTEREIEKKTKILAKRMVEIKGKVHNQILDFYQKVTSEDADEEISEGLTVS